MREFRRVLEDHRGDILLVLYEELVRDPQGTADKILRFYPGEKPLWNANDYQEVQVLGHSAFHMTNQKTV